jgi:beta-lactamase regulating signal transducer with metallopeptidase domain
MSLLLELALKTTALFLLAMLSIVLLRKRSAALRHCVLAAAFVCAIAVPALTTVTPAWHLPIPAAWLPDDSESSIGFTSTQPVSNPIAQQNASQTVRPSGARISWIQALIATWLAGAMAFAGFIVTGMWRIHRLGRAATPIVSGAWREHADSIAAAYGIRSAIRLLHSSHPTMLVTWGLLRPRILLPSSATAWPEDRVRVVLSHEIAHIRRRDWPILIAAGLLRSVHWFNPLVWLAYRRLRQESEQATDDLVLERGVAAAEYASHLLAVARETVRHRHTWSAATAIAHPSTLEGRVRAMLNHQLNRTPLTAIGRWTAMLASISATVAIASAGVSTLGAQAESVVAASAVAATRTADGRTQVELRDATVVVGDATITADRMRIEVPAARIAKPAAAAAQAKPGAINGVLYDQLGGLLPGAKVTLQQQPAGGRYETLTDRNGAFTFTLLPSGDYELTTALPGFATVTNLVKVDAGATLERSITMPMGTLQEMIQVIGPAGGAPRVLSARPANRPRPAPETRTFFTGGIGGQIKAPSKIYHVNPIYPSEAGTSSDVIKLTGRVGIDGFISDLREVAPRASATTIAHDAFVASALEATKQWEFTPVLLNNVPVEANISITVNYSAR